MRAIPAVYAVLALSVPSSPSTAQDHHASTDKRGAMVMGFDQQLTVHHFELFTDGGSIEVSVKNPSDAKNRDAIRSHLPHIAKMFSDGNFQTPMLVHDATNVPGTKSMRAHKADISYRYVEIPNGGRVNIVTIDHEALAAVHDFLRFQIADHGTGDALTVRKR